VNVQGETVKDHFISALRDAYAALDPDDRKLKIQELLAESSDNEKFIREYFPEFFDEACPSQPVVARKWGSNARSGLCAKPE
jgi:hypothetical protein